jgi:hypothetical protein
LQLCRRSEVGGPTRARARGWDNCANLRSKSQAVAVADHFRPQVEREAKARMFAGKPSGKFPEGKVRDLLGKLAGLSGRALAKAAAEVRAAPKKNPPLSPGAAGLPGGPAVQ